MILHPGDISSQVYIFRKDLHGHKYWLNCLGCLLGAFDDEDIIHVEGNVDPVRDIEIIHEELRLKDEEMMAPILDKLEKTAVRGSDKKLKPEYVSEVCLCYASVILFHICVTMHHYWGDIGDGNQSADII